MKMKLNWCEKEEDHKNSIPADILYLSKRWCNKSKKLLLFYHRFYSCYYSKYSK